MKILQKKSKIATIALILMLTLSASLVVLITVSAQPVSEIETHTYLAPQPVTGVGQEMFIVYWLDKIPSPETDEEIAAGKRGAHYGITLTITKPDGTTETIEMQRTDPVGGGYFLHSPDQVGGYSVIASFPGYWRNATVGDMFVPAGNYWIMPSESVEETFTVQEDPIEKWPDPPLTNDYWMRPISGPSHWGELAGNWLGSYAQKYPQAGSGGTTDNYGYGVAPESAHILWTRQHYPTGSIMDERFGDEVYTLNHYQDVDFDGNNLIIDGVIHYTPQYTAHLGSGAPVGSFGWAGLDLYTGELLFFDPEAIKPSLGQIYFYDSPNQHGGFSYLWRTNDVEMPDTVTRLPLFAAPETVTNIHSQPGTETWEMIDAYTRNRVCFVANVSTAGTAVYGKDGSYLRYSTVNLGTSENPNYYLRCWNVSAIPTMLVGEESTYKWQWRPQWGGHGDFGFRWRENADAFHDGNTAWSLNVSIPNLQGPRNPLSNQTASIMAVREGEYVIFRTTGQNDEQGIAPTWLMAVSLEPGHEGEKLWENSFTPPFAKQWEAGFDAGMVLDNVYPEDEVVVFSNRIELKWYVYDMRTGQQLWVSEPENAFGYYGMSSTVYDGMLLTWARAGGILNAYDIRTGEIIWTYFGEGAGTETPYGGSVTQIFAIADGKIYTSASEHSASSPLWRGPNLRCIDAETGEEIWKILFWGTGNSVADGILVGFNWYDGQVYAFGRGPSATTVTASPKISMYGSSVMIEGTVTDQTPTGRRNINNEVQFTLKGTPAISDEDMAAWMEYKFMQQAYPTDAKGVEVVLTVFDSNNNSYEIGRTTSDITGAFSYNWKPQIPGVFTITATFEGSESYGPSFSTTAIGVDPAPSPAQPIEPEPATPELTEPEPTTPEPTEPEPTEPEPTTPEPTTPEPTEPTQAPLITTEIAIVAVVAVACTIGVVSYWVLRRRK